MAIVPTYTAPPYRDPGTYTPPAWDEGAIETLTQKRAAPGLRALRQQVQRVTGRRYDNPQVGRMTLREALQGYGSGVSSVMGGASVAAAGEYGQKYGRMAEGARGAYESQAASARAYNAYMQDVSKTQYGSAMAGYETEVGQEAATTAYGRGTEAATTAYGREKEVATTAYERQQQAFKDAYDLWKEKYLWTEEQQDRQEKEKKKETSFNLKRFIYPNRPSAGGAYVA